MVIEIAGNLFAGLGLFFVGVKLIGSHLKQMAGRGLRNLVAHAVNATWRAALLGMVSGAVTQSTNAVTFIVTSMNTAGMLTIRQAMPVVIWANLGTAAIVLAATLDIHLMVFYLLGLVGMAYYFDIEKSARYRHLAGAFLGVSLLFLGLQMIKVGAAPLREITLVRDFLHFSVQSYILSFLAGVIITLVAQSSATVSIIAVTMTHAGLISMDQTILIIYGAGVGSAASLWLMGANLRGVGRQLVLLQILLKCTAAVILLVFLALELGCNIPLIKAMVATITVDMDTQAALAYLVFQLVGGLATSVFSGAIYQKLVIWSPPGIEETLAEPHFLYAQALEDTDTALDLVDKELTRQLSMLPMYLSAADHANAQKPATSTDVLFKANQAVADRIDDFLTELMNRLPDRQALDRMLNLRTKNQLQIDLREGLQLFDQLLTGYGHFPDGNDGLARTLTEAMHFILLALIDTATTSDSDDQEMLQTLTSDRSEVMERIRHKLLAEGCQFDYQIQETLFTATSLFERLVWVVRHYGNVSRVRSLPNNAAVAA